MAVGSSDRDQLVAGRTLTLVNFCELTGAPGLVLTLTTTDMPGRSRDCSATAAGTRMRTGSRCTILVELPCAFAGGRRENTEPEAGATLATLPSSLRPGNASTEMETGWPGSSLASCVSLKFAST